MHSSATQIAFKQYPNACTFTFSKYPLPTLSQHQEFPDSTHLLFNFMVKDINDNMAF